MSQSHPQETPVANDEHSPSLQEWEEGTLMSTLGMSVHERSAQCCRVRMPLDGARQVIGVLHGGATAALIETACSVAGREAAPPGQVAVGSELSVSHLKAAAGQWVEAEARPLHVGGRTCVYEARVHDDAGRLVAAGSLRLMFVPAPA